MTQGVQVQVSLNGPLFASGVDGKVRDSLNDAVNELMLRAEAEATHMAQPAPGGLFHSREYAAQHGYFQTGNYSRSINGRLVSSLHGVVTDSGSVYGPWLEGVSSANERSRFKGYHIFRKAAEKVQTMAQDVMLKHVGRLRDRLD